MKIEMKTCEFVEASEIVPVEQRFWFWEKISENAPFSWGDCNRSLVTASDFHRHIENCLDADEVDSVIDELYGSDSVEKSKFKDFMNLLVELGETYIDLEN